MSHKKLLQDTFRMDDAFSAFIDQDLQALEAELYRDEYVDLKARQWLPEKTDVPAWAESFGYRILHSFGRADWIAPYSNDLPGAGLRAEKKVARVEGLANYFEFSKQDLRAAAKNSMNLDREYAQIQMRAHEEKFNSTCLLGEPTLGFLGFFKHPDVAVLTGHNWASAGTTAQQILDDLRSAVAEVRLASKGMYEVNQIILPLSSFTQAEKKPMGVDYASADNPLAVFLRTTPGVSVGWDLNLEKADLAGTGPRMVAYMKSPMVAQCVQPLAPEIGEPQVRDLMYRRTIESRVGGCVVRKAIGMCYVDGLAG